MKIEILKRIFFDVGCVYFICQVSRIRLREEIVKSLVVLDVMEILIRNNLGVEKKVKVSKIKFFSIFFKEIFFLVNKFVLEELGIFFEFYQYQFYLFVFEVFNIERCVLEFYLNVKKIKEYVKRNNYLFLNDS